MDKLIILSQLSLDQNLLALLQQRPLVSQLMLTSPIVFVKMERQVSNQMLSCLNPTKLLYCDLAHEFDC